ncbi:8589_t:CDS:2 [Diversispora eburnea]|uniref:Signal peptidase subunit 3 n=1 Tax=Diversispora eburnea TaxID=1213867 RepID=A0A9N8UYC8_9GLOM|nr:8589_t:CDS:2 [Diversispora eburnea]
MYNLMQRANALFAFAITVLFALFGVISVVTPFLSSSPTATLNISDLQIWVYEYNLSESEFAFVDMKLEADLTSLFNWNTKQLFICVIVEYNTDTHNQNQIILWDKIIKSKEDALIKNYDIHNAYNFVDITSSFERANATYSLHWDIMPHVGMLMNGRAEKLKM